MTTDRPTAFQRRVADALGVDISGDTRRVAAARIHTLVGPAILSPTSAYGATDQQVADALALGLDVAGDSAMLAAAKIAGGALARRRAALRRHGLKPGDRVRVAGEVLVVSRIAADCRIKFKGNGGRGAWPDQVEKVVE